MYRRFIGSTILKLTFGYSVALEGQDPLVLLANKSSTAFVSAVNNLWAVDVLPFRKLSVPHMRAWEISLFTIVRHLPSWLPGMGFKNVAIEYNAIGSKSLDLPFDFVRSEVVR